MKFSAHRAIISALALSLALAGAGRPQSVTTTYGYDQYGQLVSKTDTAGASTYYTYDPAGNRTQISPNPPQSNGAPVAGAVNFGGISKNSGSTLIGLNVSGTWTSLATSTAPRCGSVTYTGSGSSPGAYFNPSSCSTGAVSFAYTATGPGGTSAPATVSLIVTP